MENTKISRLTTAALVVGSIIGTYFFAGPRNRKRRTNVVPEYNDELDTNLITPAGPTFATVWPVIYTGTLGLAVHQALPSQTDNPRYEKAAPLLVANYLLNALFGVFFSRGDKTARVAANTVTVVQLPAVLALRHALEVGKSDVPEPERTFHRTVGMYAGWITVASGVAAKQYGRNKVVAGVAGTLALVTAGVFINKLRAAPPEPSQPDMRDAAQAEILRAEMDEEPYYIDLD